MQGRTLLALFGVVALLGAFLWFFERDLPSSDAREELARRVLVLDAANASGITIETAQGRVVLDRICEGDDGTQPGWRLTEPTSYPADQHAVQALLRSLAGLDHSRALDEWEPAAVGLDDPRGRVLVARSGEADQMLEIGIDVPTTRTMIVSVAGTSVARVVPVEVWELIDKPPAEWRSRRVFRAERDEIVSVRLQEGLEVVKLERRDGTFYLAEPIEDLADVQLADDLLTGVVSEEVRDFLDDPPPLSQLGLEPAVGVLELGLEGGGMQTLELGSERPGGGRYARLGARVLVIADTLAEARSRPFAQWRSHNWLEMAPYEIEQVDVVEAGEAVSAVLVDGEWKREAATLDASVVNDFLYALDEAKALGFEAAAPRAQVRIEVALRARSGAQVDLELYPANEVGLHPARVAGRAATLLLSSQTAAKVLQKLAVLRE